MPFRAPNQFKTPGVLELSRRNANSLCHCCPKQRDTQRPPRQTRMWGILWGRFRANVGVRFLAMRQASSFDLVEARVRLGLSRAQLANITRPIVRLECLHRLLRDIVDLPARAADG